MKEVRKDQRDAKLATTLSELGACLRLAGQLGEAEVLLGRCLQIRETNLGPEHEQVANTLFQLSACLRGAGLLEEAEEMLRRCQAIEKIQIERERFGVG